MPAATTEKNIRHAKAASARVSAALSEGRTPDWFDLVVSSIRVPDRVLVDAVRVEHGPTIAAVVERFLRDGG